jgi:hypothetical protein
MKPMFLSLVRPDRISSPITNIPALTISLMTSTFHPYPLTQECRGKSLKSRDFAADLATGPPLFRAMAQNPTPSAPTQCISRWPGPCYHPVKSCTVAQGVEGFRWRLRSTR